MAETKPSSAAAPVAREFAEWAAALRPADIPDAVVRACADTVVDTLGLCYAARDTDYVRALRAAWPGQGECLVFGTGSRRDPASAAMINGTAAHGEDFDNTFEGCPVHSGTVVVPAVLAAAEAEGLSGAQALKGMAVGLEVMCRLGLAAQKGVHTAGFHPTAVLGTMGATAAVAAAADLTPRQATDALGIAGSMASGIIEYLADGSWTKRMHAGWAAQSGLRASAMGRAGFTGPATVFEGRHGLFHGFAPTVPCDVSVLTGELGTRWDAARVAFKPYACGTMAQPFVDCAVRLGRAGIAPDEVVEMVCEVGEGTVHRLWEPLALKQAPPTPYAAKFSTPYCIAVGFLRGDAGLAEYDDALIRDPAVLALAGRVRYEIDPADEYPRNYTGHIRVRLRDGRVVEERQPHLRGGARDPLTREQLVAKCRANLRHGGVAEGLARTIEQMADALRDDHRPLALAALEVGD